MTDSLSIELADALGRLAPSINRMTELVIFGTQPSSPLAMANVMGWSVDKEKTPTCLSTIIEFVETTFILHERLVRPATTTVARVF